tara:strand:+ start:268 stop:495 length:228 start_codon:yes stop_codon:yes gene_type:complete
MKDNLDITYEIKSEYFTPFKVTIRKGQLIWCSDDSHPVGCKWKFLREHYEGGNMKCKIEEYKELEDGNTQTVSKE